MLEKCNESVKSAKKYVNDNKAEDFFEKAKIVSTTKRKLENDV